MYLRETRRTNRDGSVVSYLQLAHNERHPDTGSPVAKVIHNFGRADTVDREALARLVSSISRFLTPALDEIASEVFASVAHLLNLDLDIVFVDTTSTYWETEGADQVADLADTVDDDGVTRPAEQAKRTFGHSKDFRTDLPQVVIAMAVTRDGTPIRCWTFPGNENDTAIIRTVKDDLAGWNLRRMVWVADRGFASAVNRAYLTRGGGHYIHAEKLRHTNTEAAAALARPGRYARVAGNLRVKEIHVAPGGKGDGDQGARAQRFVICHNPEQARTGRHRPGQPHRPPGPAHQRLGYLDGPQTRRARRVAEDQTRTAPVPAPHQSRAAAHRSRRRQTGSAPGRQVAAAHLRRHVDS